MKKLKIVEIIWEDACSDDNWHVANVGMAYMIRTIGLVTAENKDRIEVSVSVKIDDVADVFCSTSIVIPKTQIRKISIIGYRDKVKGLK